MWCSFSFRLTAIIIAIVVQLLCVCASERLNLCGKRLRRVKRVYRYIHSFAVWSVCLFAFDDIAAELSLSLSYPVSDLFAFLVYNTNPCVFVPQTQKQATNKSKPTNEKCLIIYMHVCISSNITYVTKKKNKNTKQINRNHTATYFFFIFFYSNRRTSSYTCIIYKY